MIVGYQISPQSNQKRKISQRKLKTEKLTVNE